MSINRFFVGPMAFLAVSSTVKAHALALVDGCNCKALRFRAIVGRFILGCWQTLLGKLHRKDSGCFSTDLLMPRCFVCTHPN